MIAKCPPPTTLKSLSLGQLTEEQSDVLITHLESCEACQHEIAQIDSAEDSLISQLKSSAEGNTDPENAFETENGCRVAMTRALAALATAQDAGPDQPNLIRTAIPESIGEYEIVRPLGHGGMGHVYLGKHTKLNRSVAIKFLADHRRWDKTMHERFESEMRLIGGLKHPNIVAAYDAREVDGIAVLVTEYIDGMTLSEILKRTGKIKVANAAKIVAEVCEALQYIESKGLVHRDIKPSNIMVDKDGKVKLLDLGLARIQPSDDTANHFTAVDFTATGQAMGTADYVPPEQINDGRNVDIRADIYSLGCTFFKLLTGHAPFAEHASVFTKMNAHVSETPASLKNNKLVPAKIANLVDSMLAKEPGSRPQSPAAMGQQLKSHLVSANLKELVAKAQTLPIQKSVAAKVSSTKPQAQASFFSRSPWATALIAAGLAGLFGFWLGTVITVKKPDGTTASVEIPAGSTAIVDSEGNIEIQLAGSAEKSRIGKEDVELAPDALKNLSLAQNQELEEGGDEDGMGSRDDGRTKSWHDESPHGFNKTATGRLTFQLPASSALYQKVKRGDLLDIYAVQKNQRNPQQSLVSKRLVAMKVKVDAVIPRSGNSFGITIKRSQGSELENETIRNYQELRFEIHDPNSQHVQERVRVTGGLVSWKPISKGVSIRYMLPTESAIFQKVETGDLVDIYQVDKPDQSAFSSVGTLVASKVRVSFFTTPNNIDLTISRDSELVKSREATGGPVYLRFEFHNPNNQSIADGRRLSGVWRSILTKRDGAVVDAIQAKYTLIFHKNQLLHLSGDDSFVSEFQLKKGSILEVDHQDKEKMRYRFLSSGRLEVASREDSESCMNRLQKIESPESESEKLAFELLAKVNSNSDYFRCYIAKPVESPTVGSDPVEGTSKHVEMIGDPVINRNHVLSAKVVEDERGKPSLSVNLTPEGGMRMRLATQQHIGEQMAMVIDGKVKISAVIRSKISGSLELTGDFTKPKLEKIAEALSTKLELPKEISQSKTFIRTKSLNKITELMLACHNYESAYGKFPAAKHNYESAPSLAAPSRKITSEETKYPMSWRVAILPYLLHQELYDQYKPDEPWDSEANLKVLNQMPDVFRHPSSPADSTETGYLGIAGVHGGVGTEKAKSVGDVTDGTSNTVFMIETKSGIPWTKPEDLLLDSLQWKSQAQFKKAFSKLEFFDPEVICAVLGDCRPVMLDRKKLQAEIDQATDAAPKWLDLLTIDDGRAIDVRQYELPSPSAPAQMPVK